MFNVNAFAVKNSETIEVTITGNLPDSCHRAIIRDIYPGGDIIYVRDPEEAQVFLREWSTSDTALCAMVLIPWSATVSLPSTKETVSVYINGTKAITVNVVTQEDPYNVWEFTHGIIPSDGSYSILPDSIQLKYPWEKQFGPENYKACAEWVMRNSDELNEATLSGNGGGSGAPRGFDSNGGSGSPRGFSTSETSGIPSFIY